MIHRYKQNGFNIVIDINSGAVHAVDELAYEIIGLYEENSFDDIMKKLEATYEKDDIKESYDEVKSLEDNGLLFSKDYYEEVLPMVNKRNPVVKALCLHVAHDCNLRCGYCFADEGEYNGKRSLMSLEVGKAAIDFIIKNSGNRRNLEIDFFGGEPLMNFNVVKEIVKYGREQEKLHNKNFRFTMTTNGVLLDEKKLEFINENMHNLVLSLDGRKEVNDHMRKCIGGSGSYDLIVPRFIKAAESRKQENYYLRGTFTKNNMDFSKDVAHIADLGFKQISVEPVVGPDEEPYTFKEEDIPAICKEYEVLANNILEDMKNGKDYNFFHFMIDLTGGPCIAKRLVGCGAGTEYLAVTPEGALYPCHQFVGNEDFEMGDVWKGVQKQDMRKEFENCNIFAKEDCKKCWARFYCSGGCAANAYNTNNDILKPYEIGCILQRKRTECAIMLKVAESLA
jgi:uncharacterized protein